MPGENFSRRVARAASVGGGRSYRRQTPTVWYMALLLICVVGVGLIAYSRYEVTHPVAVAKTSKSSVPPTKANLWEVGLDFDLCGKVHQLPATTTADSAFSTNGKGVVTIEPGLASDPAAYSGAAATLNGFLVPADVSLSNTNVTLAGPDETTTAGNTTTTTTAKSTTTTTAAKSSSTTTTTAPPSISYSNGASCEDKTGILQTEVWKSPSAKKGKILTKGAANLRFKNGQLITVAFLPKGATIPKPTSAGTISNFLLSNPTGLAPASSSTATTTTTAPATSTTVPGTSTTTSTTAASKNKGSTKTGT